MDRLASLNSGSQVPTMISTAGNNLLITAPAARSLVVPATGSFGVQGFSSSSADVARRTALTQLLGIDNQYDLVHAAEGIRQSNWPTVGQFMYASHAALRDDYEVSCKELDDVVEIAEDIGYKGGVYGCRMTGGRFGDAKDAAVLSGVADNVTGAEGVNVGHKNSGGSGAASLPPLGG